MRVHEVEVAAVTRVDPTRGGGLRHAHLALTRVPTRVCHGPRGADWGREFLLLLFIIITFIYYIIITIIQ